MSIDPNACGSVCPDTLACYTCDLARGHKGKCRNAEYGIEWHTTNSLREEVRPLRSTAPEPAKDLILTALYIDAVKAGIRRYAHWSDGEQHVGTAGKKLRDALDEIDKLAESKTLEELKTILG